MKRSIACILFLMAASTWAGTNTYLDLPTNDAAYLAAAVYVSNAVNFARQRYAEEMSHTNEFRRPPTATILVGDDVSPEEADKVYVHFIRVIGYADAAKMGENPLPYEDIRVALGKDGKVLSHDKETGMGHVAWLRVVPNTDPNVSPEGPEILQAVIRDVLTNPKLKDT